jgi:hypothetical protein
VSIQVDNAGASLEEIKEERESPLLLKCSNSQKEAERPARLDKNQHILMSSDPWALEARNREAQERNSFQDDIDNDMVGDQSCSSNSD